MIFFRRKIWLGTIFLLTSGSISAQDQPQIKITLLSQKIYQSAEGATDYRSLRFRFVNLTKHPVIIHGHGDDDGFHPLSYSIRYSKTTKQWVYPPADNKPIPWQEMKDHAYHTQQLLPQKGVVLEVKIKFEKAGEQVKKVFYLANDKNQEPYQIVSSSFRLK